MPKKTIAMDFSYKDLERRLSEKPVTPVLIDIARAEKLQAKFDNMGGEAVFGTLQRKDDRAWYFERGALVASGGTVFAVQNAIYHRWLALGGLDWSVPEMDELGTPDGLGRYTHFRRGRSIYWSPATGAWSVEGDIRKKWAELGWERSWLGYPTGDETAFDEGGQVSHFQNGAIYWWPDFGAIELRGVSLTLVSVVCNKQMDKDQSTNSDEPYAVMSVVNATMAHAARTRVYDDIDSNEYTVGPRVELFRGRPVGFDLTYALMEHDSSNPNLLLDYVNKVIHDAKLPLETRQNWHIKENLIDNAAYFGLPAVQLMFFSPLRNPEDDLINTGRIPLSGRRLVELATRTAPVPIGWSPAAMGVTFRFATPEIRGGGARYVLRFDVSPL